MFETPLVGKGNPYLVNLMQPRPLVIEDAKNISKIEFRLSKEGYKTVVVKPIQDVLIGCGPLLMIPMNKLRPLKPGETNEELNTPVKSKNSTAHSASNNQEFETRLQAQEQERLIREEQARIAKEQAQIEEERKLQDGQIHRISSNSWYYIDKYYTKKEINSIILSCPDAKAKYDDGHKWMVAGWSSAAGSVALLIIGSSMMAADTQVWYENGHQYRYSGEVWAAGLPLMLLGVCGIPTGITIAGIGHHRMNNSYKVFNNSCAAQQEPAISLNFGPTHNGIGMTLNF